jgi:hypothetical protein
MRAAVEVEPVVGASGGVKRAYYESLYLRALGKLQIALASHVEPDLDGHRWADIGLLGPSVNRSEAEVVDDSVCVGGKGEAVGHVRTVARSTLVAVT